MSLQIWSYGEPLTEEEANVLSAFIEDAISERDAIDSSVDVLLFAGTGQALTAPPEPEQATEPLERFLERVRTALLAGGKVQLLEVSA